MINVAVLGNLGRLVLSTTIMKRYMMYWMKLVSMSNHCYPRKFYNIHLQLDKVGSKTWVSCICSVVVVFYVFF